MRLSRGFEVKKQNEQEEIIAGLQEEVQRLKEKNAKLGAVLKKIADDKGAREKAQAEAERRLQVLHAEIDAMDSELKTARDAEDIRLRRMHEQAKEQAAGVVDDATAQMEEKQIKFDQQISAKQKAIYANTYGMLNGVNNRHTEYLKGIRFQQDILMATYESVIKKLSQEEDDSSPESLYDKELSVVYSRRAKLARKQGKTSMLDVKELLSSTDTVTMEFVDVEELNSLGEAGLRNNVLVGRVVLPEGLKQLPPNFFFGCINLREVVIPSTLERIREFAFYGCTALKSVQINSNVLLRIDDYAFSLCERLEKLELPSSVERLGVAAFRHCTTLEKFVVPKDSKLSRIGTHVFQFCSSLLGFDIPDGITEIPLSAFYGCSALRSLAIPATVRTVGKYALHGCSSLKRVVVCGDKLDINATFGYLTDCEFIRAKQ